MLGNGSHWALADDVTGAERHAKARRNPMVEEDGVRYVRRGGSWADPPKIVT